MSRPLMIMLLAITGACISCAQVDLASQLTSAYCNDDFNRADKDSLGDTWSFASLGYQNYNRTAKVASQQASMTDPGGGFTYIACKQNIDQKNLTVSTRITPKLNFTLPKIISVTARAQLTGSLANAYVCGVEYSGTSSRLTLYKGVNTLRTDLAISSTAQTVTGGTTYALSFYLSGNQLKCSLSSPIVDELSATDSSFSTGYAGVFAWSLYPLSTLDYTFDDFKTEVRP